MASSPAQVVSLATMLSGRHPSAIPFCGLTHRGARAETDRPWCSRLPDGVPTLPDVLALYGYETALLRDHAPGFDTFGARFRVDLDLSRPDAPGTDWSALAAAARGWWIDHAEAPRLLVVVTSDLQLAAREDLVDDLGVRGWTGETDDGRAALPSLRKKAFRRYEAEAARSGEALARLAADLPAGSRPRYTVVTSTNGVSIGEIDGIVSQRDFFFSSSLLLDRTLRVPLLVLPPAGSGDGQVRDDVVQLLDLLPTLADLGGAMRPASLAGRSLREPADAARVAWAEIGDMLAVRSGDHLLTFKIPLHNMTSLDPRLDGMLARARPGQHLFLYDVVRDAAQLRALRPDDPAHRATFDRLQQALRQTRAGAAAPPAGTLTPDRLDEIRLSAAEGYW